MVKKSTELLVGSVPAPATGEGEERLLTAQEFQGLAEVPPAVEWFANITRPRTRDAYKRDLRFKADKPLQLPLRFMCSPT